MSIMGEVAIIFGICLLSEGLVTLLPIAFPASVLSMVILLILLLTGVIKEHRISRLCSFLVGNMAFFFLPSCVGIIEYWDTLSAVLLPFLVISFLTVPLIYGATAWTVQLLSARKKGGRRK